MGARTLVFRALHSDAVGFHNHLHEAHARALLEAPSQGDDDERGALFDPTEPEAGGAAAHLLGAAPVSEIACLHGLWRGEGDKCTSPHN